MREGENLLSPSSTSRTEPAKATTCSADGVGVTPPQRTVERFRLDATARCLLCTRPARGSRCRMAAVGAEAVLDELEDRHLASAWKKADDRGARTRRWRRSSRRESCRGHRRVRPWTVCDAGRTTAGVEGSHVPLPGGCCRYRPEDGLQLRFEGRQIGAKSPLPVPPVAPRYGRGYNRGYKPSAAARFPGRPAKENPSYRKKRRGGDSNPRYPLRGTTVFEGLHCRNVR